MYTEVRRKVWSVHINRRGEEAIGVGKRNTCEEKERKER